MSLSGPILLRADASLRIGTGHVMRCIALAQALQALGAQCHFVSASLAPPLAERLGEERFACINLEAAPGSMTDARELIALAQRVHASWIVIDGYHFSCVYQRTLKDAGIRLLAVDDHAHAGHYDADIVVNPNLHASESIYDVDTRSTMLLLGTRYALLRREFWNGAGEKTFPDSARRLLVTFGGTDPDNVTETVLSGLNMVPSQDGEVTIVVGGSNPHFESLVERAVPTQWNIQIVRNVSNMAVLMRHTDLAIAASGGTTWELAAMGVPAIVVPIADNQSAIAQSLHERRAAVGLGLGRELTGAKVAEAVARLMSDRSLRVELSYNARRLVDGSGAQRAAKTMVDFERGAATP